MDATRKRKVVSTEEKLNAIKTITNEYDVGISTLSEWRRNLQQIERWNSVWISSVLKRKTMKANEYDKIDKLLYLWFTQQQDQSIQLSGSILQQEAIETSKDLLVDETLKGWLYR